jgi:hypothetical protein
MRLAILALTPLFLLQNANPSANDLIRLQRPLSASEIDTVIRGIRNVVAGVTLRLASAQRPPVEILMNPAGKPSIVRTRHNSDPRSERVAGTTVELPGGKSVTVPVPEPVLTEQFILLYEYTGVPARRCDGGAANGDLVIQYLLDPTTKDWTATAREWSRHDGDMTLPLDILGTSGSRTSGEPRVIGNRQARAIVSPMPESYRFVPALAGDPAPNPDEFVPMQTLWIDTVTLRPVRWEVSQRQAITNRVDFAYDSLALQRPAGVTAPQCIS